MVSEVSSISHSFFHSMVHSKIGIEVRRRILLDSVLKEIGMQEEISNTGKAVQVADLSHCRKIANCGWSDIEDPKGMADKFDD